MKGRERKPSIGHQVIPSRRGKGACNIIAPLIGHQVIPLAHYIPPLGFIFSPTSHFIMILTSNGQEQNSYRMGSFLNYIPLH